jgi:hypothetical protein
MRPLLTKTITGATAGVTVNLGFRPQYAKVITITTGASAEAIRGMAAAKAALNVPATAGATDDGGAGWAASGGLTFGGQSVTVGADALADGVVGYLLVLG